MRWISFLALIVGIGGIAFFWSRTKDLNQRVSSLEQKMTTSNAEIQQHNEKLTSLRTDVDEIGKYTGRLLTETGKLVVAKQAVEAEENVLKTNPSELIDVLDMGTVEKGIFNIQTKVNKVHLRNKSRFNVREIQIHASYVDKSQTETGTTATIYVHDLLVAGESKWFEAHNAPWADGRPGAKMRVTSVEIIGK